METPELSNEVLETHSCYRHFQGCDKLTNPPESSYLTLDDLLKEQWLRKRDSGELKWVTKNGDKIALKNMSDAHLANAIKCLSEQNEFLGDAINYEHEDAGDRI
jgi:hypothetical protein